jgi:signal transduction histidine kinase
MGPSNVDFDGLVHLCQKFTDAFHRGREEPPRRCHLLTETLHALGSPALSGCWLAGKNPAVVVFEKDGPRPDLATALAPSFTAWAQAAMRDASTKFLATKDAGLGHLQIHAALVKDGSAFAILLTGMPATESEEVHASARSRLAWAAAYLSPLFQLEACEAERKALLVEQERQAGLIGIADLTDVVAHEFNNILNNILLHLAILEQGGLPTELRGETGLIRQKGLQAAAMVKKLQQLSRRQHPQLEPLDLNAVVRTTVETLGEPADSSGIIPLRAEGSSHRSAPTIGVRLELAEDLPPVLATWSDVKRLLEVLLRNAVASSTVAGPPIVVRTAAAANKQTLAVSDTGPEVPAEELRQLFEPFATTRHGSDGLRLAIAKAVARRLQGTLRAENQPEGGVAFVVELQSAPIS